MYESEIAALLRSLVSLVQTIYETWRLVPCKNICLQKPKSTLHAVYSLLPNLTLALQSQPMLSDCTGCVENPDCLSRREIVVNLGLCKRAEIGKQTTFAGGSKQVGSGTTFGSLLHYLYQASHGRALPSVGI